MTQKIKYLKFLLSPRSASQNHSLSITPPYNNNLQLHTLSSPSLTPVKHVSVNSTSAHQLFTKKDKNLINQVGNLRVENQVKYDRVDGLVNMYNPEDDDVTRQKPQKRGSIHLFRAFSSTHKEYPYIDS